MFIDLKQSLNHFTITFFHLFCRGLIVDELLRHGFLIGFVFRRQRDILCVFILEGVRLSSFRNLSNFNCWPKKRGQRLRESRFWSRNLRPSLFGLQSILFLEPKDLWFVDIDSLFWLFVFVVIWATSVVNINYRVTMVVGDMGWVDFDSGCSTILPSYPANSSKTSWVTITIVNPTFVPDRHCHSVTT